MIITELTAHSSWDRWNDQSRAELGRAGSFLARMTGRLTAPSIPSDGVLNSSVGVLKDSWVGLWKISRVGVLSESSCDPISISVLSASNLEIETSLILIGLSGDLHAGKVWLRLADAGLKIRNIQDLSHRFLLS